MVRSWKFWAILIALILTLCGGLVILVRTNDGLYVQYKRLKAADRYVFDVVRPELADQDPSDSLSIRSADDLDAARAALSVLVYGGDGARNVVTPYYGHGETGSLQQAQTLEGIASARHFYLSPRPDVLSFIYLLTPKTPIAKRGLIYHHGFAGGFMQQEPLIEAALYRGYTIVAIDQLAYGENSRKSECDIDPEPDCQANLQFDLDRIHDPLRLHVEPVRAAIDLLEMQGITDISAIGFSAGAATITLTAALDNRITRSVAAAGVLPYYLREGQDAPIGIADYAPLGDRFSMIDLFLLSASGEGREHMHLFNRYDRCCFRNVKGLLYSPLLSETLGALGRGGAFEVRIDETHARHTISDWGSNQIFSFLEQPLD